MKSRLSMGLVPLCLALGACVGGAHAPSAERLPIVMVEGDSISLGYIPYLAEEMQGRMTVVHSPRPAGVLPAPPLPTNGADSGTQARNIEGWLKEVHPDVVHFNAGLWDVSFCHVHKYQNDLQTYLSNLKAIVTAIRAYGAKPIFATTTPVLPQDDCWHESDIEQYNSAAVKLMQSLDVQVDDLWAAMDPVQAQYHPAPEEGHFTEAGSRFLAAQVARSLSNTPKPER